MRFKFTRILTLDFIKLIYILIYVYSSIYLQHDLENYPNVIYYYNEFNKKFEFISRND